jgi:hypothetical protein
MYGASAFILEGIDPYLVYLAKIGEEKCIAGFPGLESDAAALFFRKWFVSGSPVKFEDRFVLSLDFEFDKRTVIKKQKVICTAQQADDKCKPAYNCSCFRLSVEHIVSAFSASGRADEVEVHSESKVGTETARTNAGTTGSSLASSRSQADNCRWALPC